LANTVTARQVQPAEADATIPFGPGRWLRIFISPAETSPAGSTCRGGNRRHALFSRADLRAVIYLAQKMLSRSGDFLAQVGEHRQTGDVIHLGLEAVFVL
jgi:hypothetical protein